MSGLAHTTSSEKYPAIVPAGSVSVPARVNLDEPLRTMAQYAVAALLEPLAILPVWVEGDHATEHLGLYYGPPASCAAGEIQLAFDARAAGVLSGDAHVAATDLRWVEWNGETWPVLFVDGVGAPDIVASTFYLLAGLDEVKSTARDIHDRPRFEDSIQGRGGFADKPVVDVYRKWLEDLLLNHGIRSPGRSWAGRRWAVCPTFDVDYLWKWRKGMIYRETVRNLLLNDREKPVGKRIRRFGSFVADALSPRDVYRLALSRMVYEVRARGGTATIFLKAGAHGPGDVAYSLRGRWLRDFIDSAQETGFEFGLHPSYYAHTHARYLSEEVERITSALSRRPTSVRQHYLRYRMPVTMNLHEEAGFRIDTTLGFSDEEGFRRGTCMPFRLYDAQGIRSTELWEMPLAAMDGGLFNRRGYSVREAVDATKRLMDQCRGVGGCAVLLWHNVLWDEMDAPGWGQHFLEVLDYAKSEGALISSLESALRQWQQSAAS